MARAPVVVCAGLPRGRLLRLTRSVRCTPCWHTHITLPRPSTTRWNVSRRPRAEAQHGVAPTEHKEKIDCYESARCSLPFHVRYFKVYKETASEGKHFRVSMRCSALKKLIHDSCRWPRHTTEAKQAPPPGT